MLGKSPRQPVQRGFYIELPCIGLPALGERGEIRGKSPQKKPAMRPVLVSSAYREEEVN